VATDVVRTVPGITVSIARDPALVRTVRLVAAAVARRASRDEEFVEEVRLAVGEACALMVAADQDSTEPVVIRLSTNGRLRVDVASATPPPGKRANDLDGVEPWALLRGLIEDFSMDSDERTTTLSMSWPLG
jgi:hypothetical protein